MTSKERVEAAFSHREPDRTPMFEYVLLSPVADGLLGRPYFDYRGQGAGWDQAVAELGFEEALRRYVANRLDLAQLLGHDMLYVSPNPLPPSGEAPVPPPRPEDCRHGLSDDPVERVALRNKARREAFEAAQAKERPGDRLLVFSLLKEEMNRRGIDLSIIVPDYAHGIWTDVDLMETMALEPEVAKGHFKLCTESAVRMARRYAACGVSLIGIGGDFAGRHPLISAGMYRTFIMPELYSLSQEIHKLGGRSVNTSDGDLWYVIDDFLLGTGSDGYMEIDQSAGMDLSRLKGCFGDKITFVGNIDCGNLLSFASEDKISQAVVSCLEAGLGNGGHIFTASNAISESVPLENYVAMVNAYRDFWGIKRLDLQCELCNAK